MNHVRHSITRLLLGLLFLALAPVQVAHAGFEGGQWTTGFSTNWATGITATSSQWTPGGSPSTGNTQWGVSGGLPSASSRGQLPIGRSFIDVDARVVPDRTRLGPALSKFLRGFGVVGSAMAVIDLARELKYILNPDGTISKEDPTVCTVAPCFNYEVRDDAGTGVFYSSPLTACQAFLVRHTSAVPGYSYPFHSVSSAGTSCNFSIYQGATLLQSVASRTIYSYSKSPSEPVYLPSTFDQFGTDVANKTDWPVDSKLPAAIKEIADAGEPIHASSPVLSGPTSAAGPTSTTTNPDGSTVVRTETYNIVYNGNTINYTTTIVTNNNGQVTTEVKPSEPPTDVCEMHPDTVGCQNLDTPTSDTLKTKNHAVTVTAVPFSSSSVCPGPLSFTVRGASYGVSYQPLCDRLALLKTLFLALAGVLAAFIVADSFRVT